MEKGIRQKGIWWSCINGSFYQTFDTLNLDFLTAKLHAYGSSEESLQLIRYLTNHWQRTVKGECEF